MPSTPPPSQPRAPPEAPPRHHHPRQAVLHFPPHQRHHRKSCSCHSFNSREWGKEGEVLEREQLCLKGQRRIKRTARNFIKGKQIGKKRGKFQLQNVLYLSCSSSGVPPPPSCPPPSPLRTPPVKPPSSSTSCPSSRHNSGSRLSFSGSEMTTAAEILPQEEKVSGAGRGKRISCSSTTSSPESARKSNSPG